MRIGLARRLTYANVTATIALTVALGGGSAYAINEWNSSNIQNETLLSEDLKDGQVRWSDIGADQVTGSRVKPASLFSSDLKDREVKEPDIAYNSITASHVRFDTLGGQDINERSLSNAFGWVMEHDGEVPMTCRAGYQCGVAGAGVTLSPGSHLLLAEITLGNVCKAGQRCDGANTSICDLDVDGDRVDTAYETLDLPVDTRTLSMQGVVSLTEPGRVGLECVTNDGGTSYTVGFSDLKITALALSSHKAFPFAWTTGG